MDSELSSGGSTAPPRWALHVHLALVHECDLTAMLVMLVFIVFMALWWPSELRAAATTEPRFVGSDACVGCHLREAQAWAGSQHAHAMQEANERSIAGDFSNRKFKQSGNSARFFKRDGQFFVRIEGPDGKPADFQIKYTFGVQPLQQYLVELPRGRLQALTIAWDTEAKRWFSLYPKEKIHAGDELHWTGRLLNWNFMCADCHSVDVHKNYDAHTGTFATTWAEIHVGCESCHGPGSNHLGWAKERGTDPAKGLTVALDERSGVKWTIDIKTGNAVRSRSRDSEREIEVCAQCHARRAQIAEGYYAGKSFLDYYVPTLLISPFYYVDGQQRDEDYNWASFLQSRMYRAGVTCNDCHDPHTEKLRAPGNAVCAQCHAPQKYDATAHHHHSPSSPGAQCVSCHMSDTTYMVVDPRRDHSMRVPRPDLTVSLGVPNACNACHSRQDAKWAAETVRQWYGHDARGLQDFGPVFDDADLGKPRAGASLAAIAGNPSQPAIVRASALARLSAAPTPAAANAGRDAARNSDPLLRLAAAQLADSLPPRERVAIAAPLLADPLRAVRIEAANAIAGLPEDQMTTDQRTAWRRAADDYIAAQQHNADRPEARANLGGFYARLGRSDDAQAEFGAALKLDRRYVPAYVNAADTYRTQGRDEDAIRILREGIAAVPASAPLHHSLGLAYVRTKQQSAAMSELARATQLAPDSARYAYVYAVALYSGGRKAEAIRALERDAKRWPTDRDILLALATMQRDAGHRDAARRAAQSLLAADPSDPEAGALLEQLK